MVSASGSSISGWIPIRIQSGSRVLRTKNWKKFTAERNLFFWINNYNLPVFLGLHKRTFKLQNKPSALKREHPALKNMKFLNFFCFSGSLLPSCIRFRIPTTDPDSLTWLNPDPIWIRIRNIGISYVQQQYILSEEMKYGRYVGGT